MKKVLKLSSLLAAVLLLAALAGVQLLTAQAVRTSVDVEMDYVSNDVDATNMFVVTIVDADTDGLRTLDGTHNFRFATVTVENITREARPDDKGKPGNKVDLTAGGADRSAPMLMALKPRQLDSFFHRLYNGLGLRVHNGHRISESGRSRRDLEGHHRGARGPDTLEVRDETGTHKDRRDSRGRGGSGDYQPDSGP